MQLKSLLLPDTASMTQLSSLTCHGGTAAACRSFAEAAAAALNAGVDLGCAGGQTP